MCLNDSIHASYRLSHTMVLRYLVRTKYVPHIMSEYKSTTHNILALIEIVNVNNDCDITKFSTEDQTFIIDTYFCDIFKYWQRLCKILGPPLL